MLVFIVILGNSKEEILALVHTPLFEMLLLIDLFFAQRQ
jgi:hypothetical protein